MGKHRADCPHCARIRAVVQDFRAAREAAELRREAATAGYSTENREYGQLITFKDYLKQTASENWRDAS